MTDSETLLAKYQPAHIATFSAEPQVFGARFSPCGKFLVAGSFLGQVRRWDANIEIPPVDPKAKNKKQKPVTNGFRQPLQHADQVAASLLVVIGAGLAAQAAGLSMGLGALVAGVGSDGPAGIAGIQQGDVILRFDGQEVGEMKALPRIVANTRIGKTVKVEVWRKGALTTLEVAIAEMEESSAKVASIDNEAKPEPVKGVELLGMRLSTLTDEARETFKVKEGAEGVLVLEVAAESSAAKKGLQPGDLIVEVQQNTVATPGDVAKQIELIRDSNKTRAAKKVKTVLLLVERASTKRCVAVQLDGAPQKKKHKPMDKGEGKKE